MSLQDILYEYIIVDSQIKMSNKARRIFVSDSVYYMELWAK